MSRGLCFIQTGEAVGMAYASSIGTHKQMQLEVRAVPGYGYPVIGNILKNDPRQAWKSEAARQIRKASKN